jgi:hypothetical protein
MENTTPFLFLPFSLTPLEAAELVTRLTLEANIFRAIEFDVTPECQMINFVWVRLNIRLCWIIRGWTRRLGWNRVGGLGERRQHKSRCKPDPSKETCHSPLQNKRQCILRLRRFIGKPVV